MEKKKLHENDLYVVIPFMDCISCSTTKVGSVTNSRVLCIGIASNSRVLSIGIIPSVITELVHINWLNDLCSRIHAYRLKLFCW